MGVDRLAWYSPDLFGIALEKDLVESETEAVRDPVSEAGFGLDGAELREQNVDVTVLQPGPVATEFEQMSGEQRPDSVRDEAAEDCVLYALEALGRQPSVVSGGWYNWIRANANRFVPRTVMICLAGDLIEKQTPIDRR